MSAYADYNRTQPRSSYDYGRSLRDQANFDYQPGNTYNRYLDSRPGKKTEDQPSQLRNSQQKDLPSRPRYYDDDYEREADQILHQQQKQSASRIPAHNSISPQQLYFQPPQPQIIIPIQQAIIQQQPLALSAILANPLAPQMMLASQPMIVPQPTLVPQQMLTPQQMLVPQSILAQQTILNQQSMHESMKQSSANLATESYIEYLPKEVQYIEYQTIKKIIQVPVNEEIIEFVPILKGSPMMMTTYQPPFPHIHPLQQQTIQRPQLIMQNQTNKRNTYINQNLNRNPNLSRRTYEGEFR